MPMFWYQTGVWRETQDLYVWNGTTWKQVLQCWIWNGLDWKLTHNAPSTLSTVTIRDLYCNPTGGIFEASWTYSSPNPNDWQIKIEVSFSGGSWTVVQAGTTLDNTPYVDDLTGLPGFTSLDNTDFRVSMLATSDGTTHAINSPATRFPPYAC